jgi:hypothetical protein
LIIIESTIKKLYVRCTVPSQSGTVFLVIPYVNIKVHAKFHGNLLGYGATAKTENGIITAISNFGIAGGGVSFGFSAA